MSFAALRDSITATKNVVYMNTGYTGPSPQPVVDRIRDVLQQEAAAGGASPEGLRLSRQISGEAQAAVANLLSVPAEDVLLTHGTTEGLHVVIYGLAWRPGDELVTCNLEHPALATPASVLEERFGVVPKRVEVPSDAGDVADIVDRFAAAITSRTKLVALSHVQFSCGLRLPIKEIVDVAHANGVPLAVDGAQTGGQLAIDVPALGADFYSISGQKWLLGPQGTGAIYFSPAYRRQIEPLFSTHALADARGFGGEGGGSTSLLRYRVASQNAALVAGFAQAISLAQASGLGAIEARARALSDRMKAGLASIAGCRLTSPTAGQTSCGLTSVALEGWDPNQVVDALWQRWRIAIRGVAFPPAVRFSTHAFNTEEEIDLAIEAMRTLAGEPPPPPSVAAH
jgi:L-cysteine/cystine lyase